jgi:hypothetical protein
MDQVPLFPGLAVFSDPPRTMPHVAGAGKAGNPQFAHGWPVTFDRILLCECEQNPCALQQKVQIWT